MEFGTNIDEEKRDRDILVFWSKLEFEVKKSPLKNPFFLLVRYIARVILIEDNSQAVVENFIWHLQRIWRDKTKNQMLLPNMETVSHLYFDSLSRVEFKAEAYAHLLTNELKIKPVLLNFQKNIQQEDVLERLLEPPPLRSREQERAELLAVKDPRDRAERIRRAKSKIVLQLTPEEQRNIMNIEMQSATELNADYE